MTSQSPCFSSSAAFLLLNPIQFYIQHHDVYAFLAEHAKSSRFGVACHDFPDFRIVQPSGFGDARNLLIGRGRADVRV